MWLCAKGVFPCNRTVGVAWSFDCFGRRQERTVVRFQQWVGRAAALHRPAMTQNSTMKLLNGDTCHRTNPGKTPGANGFVKSHCLFQKPQKRYRRSAEKVRPTPALQTPENTQYTSAYKSYSRGEIIFIQTGVMGCFWLQSGLRILIREWHRGTAIGNPYATEWSRVNVTSYAD